MPDEPKKPVAPSKEDMADRFGESVTDLINKMDGAATRFEDVSVRATAPPAPAPAPEVPLTKERINEIAADPEKGIGEVLQEGGRTVLGPMAAQPYLLQKKSNRRAIEKDPELGKLAKKHAKAVDTYIKEHNISDVELATEGFEPVLKAVLAGDPEFQEERANARADEIVAERKKKEDEDAAAAIIAAGPAPGPVVRPSERPHVGAVVAPSAEPSKTEAEEIAKIDMDAEELEFQRRYFKMTPEQAKRARFERLRMEKTHGGPLGIKGLGGYPIATLEDIGLGPKE